VPVLHHPALRHHQDKLTARRSPGPGGQGDPFVRAIHRCGGVHFRARDNAARLDDVVKFNRETVRTSDGQVAAVGLEILMLDDNGRIRIDYQFIER
jgi:hypothetical protein